MLNRFGTDEEALADVEVGQAVADELEHLALTRGQKAVDASAGPAAGTQFP